MESNIAMKKGQIKLWGSAFACALVALSGCYNYEKPAVATLSESYTERQKDNRDEIFKDIKLLTLREAQRIAIKNNPTYISAYHAMEAARLKYLQAWGAYSPSISASFDMGYTTKWMINYDDDAYPQLKGHSTRDKSFTTQTGIQANMLLFDGFARLFRLKAAKSGFNYQAKLEENACRTMMLSVAYAYNTVLLAIENRRIASEDRDFQKSSLENTRHKFEAGAAPLSDVLNFEIYVNSAEVNLVDADYQYEVAVYALAQLMGYPEGVLPSHIKFPSDYKSEFAELPAVELYLDAALANRPDLQAYREQLNIANYQVYQAWGAYSPVVNGYVGWSYGTNHNKGYATNEENRFNDDMRLTMGISADWTIFNGAIRYNQLREAKAQLAVAEYSVAAQWFAVVGEVRTAYANYVQNVKKTKLFAKIRSLSSEQRRLVDEEYRAGKAELTRLNEAQRDLVDAETALASSYINIQNAKAQLTSVVGGQGAGYYLGEEKEERYPGLDGVKDAVASAESGNAGGQTSSVKAPDVKRDFSKKSNAPAIPPSATAAPAAK